MPFIASNKFYGALALERMFPHSIRRLFARILTIGIVILLVPIAYDLFTKLMAATSTSVAFLNTTYRALPSQFLYQPATFWLGLLYLLVAPRLLILALESYLNSRTADTKGNATHPTLIGRLNFYATTVWFKSASLTGKTNSYRLLSALPKTTVGIFFLARLGVSQELFKEFLNEQTANHETKIETLQDAIEHAAGGANKEITFANLMTGLLEVYKPLYGFLGERGVTREMFYETARWVERAADEKRTARRWWRRQALARIPGLGKGWAYGKSILLNQFTQDLTHEALSTEERLIGRRREIELFESALLKKKGANIVLVGQPGAGRHTILFGLTRMIVTGKIFPALEHKQILRLTSQAIVAEGKTKGETEALLLKILNETTRVGNVILVIEDFPEFVESLSALGSSAVELLTPYLSSNAIHIVALSQMISFRRVLENQTGLMSYFERIDITEPSPENLIKILEDLAPITEIYYGNRVIITYPALQKIAEGATRYLVTGGLPRRATDLLEDAAKEASIQRLPLVTPELVMAVIKQKTKIPVGEITKEEQAKLLQLEEKLHSRVVGQNEAVEAIANTIRRARSGIQNPKRPIGTFLFLGPTGVGKTETAKALAATYFDDEEKMLRFDMSEYQADEDLQKLIGSFEKNQPGLLSSRIRTNPYSVVLLDEFEKSSREIRNLFLQILDEGFFTDYAGQKINMRNTIIIATSNAGANLIWDLVKQKLDPSQLSSRITEHIQKEKVLSPELLNRFDAAIVFHPLDLEALKKIARLLLEKLAVRIKKQNNITLKLTDELIGVVAEGGYNPTMGARPMQRFIQDHVEKIVADKIISGEIKTGATLTITPDMIQ